MQVGDWVVQQAARDCQRWMQAGLPPVRVAVNIAPAQLRHPDFERSFLQAIQPWSASDWGLDIEITEGVLQDDSAHGNRQAADGCAVRASHRDRRFRHGLFLAEPAGRTAHRYAEDRPQFRQPVAGQQSGSSLVRTIIALARTFDMTTVAEGVETQEQLDLLWQLGCDQSQGFLHSAAMTAEDFGQALQQGRGALLLPPDTDVDAVMYVQGL